MAPPPLSPVKALEIMRRVFDELRPPRFAWTADMSIYGKPEHWQPLSLAGGGPLKGDCEDYALTACARLVELGLDPAQVRLHFCIVPRAADGGGHCIATALPGDGGEYALDIRMNAIWPVRELGYRMVAFRQYDWPPLEWRQAL